MAELPRAIRIKMIESLKQYRIEISGTLGYPKAEVTAGGVEVGEASWIGVGSCIRHSIKIGANVMIGAGAVIVKDVPNGVTMVGVAASKTNS
jgi:serine acetyltransferase